MCIFKCACRVWLCWQELQSKAELTCSRRATTTGWSSKNNIFTFSEIFKEKCIARWWELVSIIIFHPSKLWKAKFFILCNLIFLVMLVKVKALSWLCDIAMGQPASFWLLHSERNSSSYSFLNRRNLDTLECLTRLQSYCFAKKPLIVPGSDIRESLPKILGEKAQQSLNADIPV